MSPRAEAAIAPPGRGTSAALDAVFFALADSTRRGLLARLREHGQTAGTLAAGFDVTRPAVSRHLRVLRMAALVREERRGRERVYSLEPRSLRLVGEWIDDYRVFWSARLHDLKQLVESLPDDEPVPAPAPRRRARGHRPRRSR
jgi:DNA-binding transcriptional ArsR family regulator